MDRDPAVVRHVSGPWSDPGAHRAFVEARTRGPYPPGLGYWTISCGEDARFIGWVLLIPVDAKGPEIEIGWRLVRAAWRQGYATEAALPIVHHAFATQHVSEVIADIDPANIGSTRVAQKLGLRPRAHLAGGTVRYTLTADEYARSMREGLC